jgi:hypothetical protein
MAEPVSIVMVLWMKRMKKYLCNLFKLLILLFYGCTYDDFVSSDVSYSEGVFNQARDKIAFARYYSTFQRPTGISRFPDGGQVKKIHTSFDLYLMNLTDKSVKRIADIHLGKYYSLPPFAHVSWGGDKLIYTRYVSKSYITIMVNPDGSGKRELGPLGPFPQISPDGKFIAFERSSEIWVRDLETEKERMLFKNDNLWRVYWEQSGRFIYGKMKKMKNRKMVRISVATGKGQFVKEYTNMFDNSISIKKVKEYTSAVDYADWGYPTPLDYNKKSVAQYEKDLIMKRGDAIYRDAVANKLLREYDRKKIDEVILKMEQRLKELEGSEKIYYRMYLPEMRAKLASH